jgi:hypothetical protein
MKITRAWAMPSRHTFTIKPIAELLKRYVKGKSVDPFCGLNSPATLTNDLNPAIRACSNVDAIAFCKGVIAPIDVALFDPPYSPRQISECYKSIGKTVGMKDTQTATLYSKVKNELAPKMPKGSIAISFGWNTVGFGLKRGFEIEEILLVCHGGAHNDTIVVVERKVIDLSDDPQIYISQVETDYDE